MEFSTNDITDVTEIQFIKLLWGMKEIVLTKQQNTDKQWYTFVYSLLVYTHSVILVI